MKNQNVADNPLDKENICTWAIQPLDQRNCLRQLKLLYLMDGTHKKDIGELVASGILGV